MYTKNWTWYISTLIRMLIWMSSCAACTKHRYGTWSGDHFDYNINVHNGRINPYWYAVFQIRYRLVILSFFETHSLLNRKQLVGSNKSIRSVQHQSWISLPNNQHPYSSPERYTQKKQIEKQQKKISATMLCSSTTSEFELMLLISREQSDSKRTTLRLRRWPVRTAFRRANPSAMSWESHKFHMFAILFTCRHQGNNPSQARTIRICTPRCIWSHYYGTIMVL